MSLDSLNEQFALPGLLRFCQADDGLVKASVTTDQCEGELYLQGAHVTAWIPKGHAPVLFLSDHSLFAPGKAIRGGIPVIFPWFGPRQANPSSSRTDGPSHGFARILPWEVTSTSLVGDDLSLSLALAPSETTANLGYDNFHLVLEVSFGSALTVTLKATNTGPAPMYLEEALHTYLSVGDVTQTRIGGLDGVEFIDKVDSFRRKMQDDSILSLTEETDRVYLRTRSTVTVEDPGLKRRIIVTKGGSESTVVWNPWEKLSSTLPDMSSENWRRMLCIETANAADDAIVLAPGSCHTMETRLTVEGFE